MLGYEPEIGRDCAVRIKLVDPDERKILGIHYKSVFRNYAFDSRMSKTDTIVHLDINAIRELQDHLGELQRKYMEITHSQEASDA